MGNRVTIDPITRLEGHGKIDIFLNDAGQRRSGLLPSAGTARVRDDLPRAAWPKTCRRSPRASAAYAPRLTTWPAPRHWTICIRSSADRNRPQDSRTRLQHVHVRRSRAALLLPGRSRFRGRSRRAEGGTKRPGSDRQSRCRRGKTSDRDAQGVPGLDDARIAGKAIHPVLGLPGGVAKRVTPEIQAARRKSPITQWTSRSSASVSSTTWCSVTRSTSSLIMSPAYTHQTYYMGLVDDENHVNFYDGRVRVVDPAGREYATFRPQEYLEHIAEHVEPWTYVKFCYLRKVGWKGFEEGRESGVYAVAPLARLNASRAWPHPKHKRNMNGSTTCWAESRSTRRWQRTGHV